MNVFILATCRNPELLPYTELVFKTLRVGFPTADVTVYLNGKVPDSVFDLAIQSKCDVIKHEPTIHHEWIQELAVTQQEPFYVVDTDIIFYQSFERFVFEAPIAGWRIPEWRDEFTNTITRPRLHGSLLYIDPIKVLEELKKYDSQFPDTHFNPRINPYHPIVIPIKNEPYFYDTCGILYHAIGGQSFNQEQLDCYFHFNFGTISDLVLPRIKDGKEIGNARNAVMENNSLGRGAWRQQEQYYLSRQPTFKGLDVITPVGEEDFKKAVKWNTDLCLGNTDAMAFNNLWYDYCHGIDDLIDTMEDGRPIMSRDQILSLFLKAAGLYNSRFFVQYRELLFPIVLDTTNTYSISVEWEKSPQAHLRTMADVFRTSGNRMFSMVAMICGGPEHMKKMSMAINERDWLGQHDDKGNPI